MSSWAEMSEEIADERNISKNEPEAEPVIDIRPIMSKGYTLISGCEKANGHPGFPSLKKNKKDLYVDIHMRNDQYRSTVIICKTFARNKSFFVDINSANSYNVYIRDIGILDQAYLNVKYKSFRPDIDHFDKLAAVHFNIQKTMDIFVGFMNKIIDEKNYAIIKANLEDSNSQMVMDCYYKICIQGLRNQLANFNVGGDKIKALFTHRR